MNYKLQKRTIWIINILFFFILKSINCEDILSLDLTIQYGIYNTELQLYNENENKIQSQYANLNLKTSNTYLHLDSLTNLTYYNSYIIEDEEFEIIMLQFNVGLYFNNKQTTRINIEGSTNSSMSYIVSGISFAHSFYNYNYSITHQLYNDKKISKLAFTLYPGNSNKIYSSGGKIYFGNAPSHLLKSKLISSCGITNSKYWSCNISEIIVSNENNNDHNTLKYIINEPIAFIVHQGFTRVPRDYLNYLGDNLFKDFLDKKLCWFGRYHSQYGIMCSYKCKNYNMFEGIKVEFVINGFVFKREMNDMFIFYEDMMVFEMTYYFDYWNGGLEWEIGGYFLQKYITEFDYEKQEIRFYERCDEVNDLFKVKVIIWNACLLGVGSLLLIVILLKLTEVI